MDITCSNTFIILFFYASGGPSGRLLRRALLLFIAKEIAKSHPFATDKPSTSHFYRYIRKNRIDVTFSYTIYLKSLIQKYWHTYMGSLLPMPLGSQK